MKIQFQYTFDDFREAATAYRSEVAWQRVENARQQKRPSVVIGVLIFAFLAAGVMLVRTGMLRSDTNPAVSKFNPFDLLIPFGSIFLVLMIGRLFTPRVKHDKRSTRRVIGVMGWVVFIAVIAILFLLRSDETPIAVPIDADSFHLLPRPTVVQQLVDTLTGHFIWLAMLVLICWLIVRGNRTNLLRTWETTPSLHRPYQVEITGERVVFETPITREEFHWPAFTRFDETEHLFLLGESGIMAHMLPKRAFAGDEEREAFRNIARGQIRSAEDAADNRGFAVITSGAAPVLDAPKDTK